MSKVATIASLVRAATKTEVDFETAITGVFEEEDPQRIADFFDRLNIPRSQGSEELYAPLPKFLPAQVKSKGYPEERAVSKGIQKFLDRHERKIKWHATHAALDGVENVLLLFRWAMAITDLRLQRIHSLLKLKSELTPEEWSIVRELINHSYLSFRNFLNLVANEWIDAMQTNFPREELSAKLGNFYEIVDQHIRMLEDHRNKIENRRSELTVIPDGFPPVKPPNYFGGDLLGRGPWKQYWNNVDQRAHHFREAID